MTGLAFNHSALILGVVATSLAGCDRSQLPIGTPGAMPQSLTIAAPGSAASTIAIVNRAVRGPYKVLHRFRGYDGANPTAGLINVNGTLYGTTYRGSADRNGSIFSITGTGIEKTLYSFGPSPDGAYPYASLIDVKGTLYGTTQLRGANGSGTVFSVTPTGREKVLYSFKDSPDGKNPDGTLVNVRGTFYGTTDYGGNNYGEGTVFSVTTTGIEKVLYTFGGFSDGAAPVGTLVNVNGTLYGTTDSGGSGECNGGCGTVFSITTAGAEKVLHRFGGGSDGAHPVAGLTNVSGTLYGTTSSGGSGKCAAGCGTVFSVTRTGTERVLYNFAGGSDGTYPLAGLINVDGMLFGTTYYGGTNDYGTVFSVTTIGAEKVLYNFSADSDGSYPNANLINVKGTLYGTTRAGGGYGCHRYGPGCGTVFAYTP